MVSSPISSTQVRKLGPSAGSKKWTEKRPQPIFQNTNIFFFSEISSDKFIEYLNSRWPITGEQGMSWRHQQFLPPTPARKILFLRSCRVFVKISNYHFLIAVWVEKGCLQNQKSIYWPSECCLSGKRNSPKSKISNIVFLMLFEWKMDVFKSEHHCLRAGSWLQNRKSTYWLWKRNSPKPKINNLTFWCCFERKRDVPKSEHR